MIQGKSQRKITLEDLAVMVAKGFAEADKKFTEVDKMFAVVIDDLKLVKDEVHDIKMNMSPLIQMLAIQDRERRDLETRVLRLERKTGIVKIK